MDDGKILLTGDYFHSDFQQLVRQNHNSITLIGLQELVVCCDVAEDHCMIVIAQSRRNQFRSAFLEHIGALYPHLPVIALLGSWCEGETRSGDPAPGLIRVYWHQWQGRFNTFRWQLANRQIAAWNLPRTYDLADHALEESKIPKIGFDQDLVIGISALRPEHYAMIHDVCQSAALRSIWLNTGIKANELEDRPDIILVDANSMNSHLSDRVKRLRIRFPHTACIAMLNFPRQFDMRIARQAGLEHVMSKPFCVNDLYLLLNDVLSRRGAA